jgi:chemotaxis protein CheX
MPTIDCIPEASIREHITSAIKEVFSTMLGQHVLPYEPSKEANGQAWPPLDGKQGEHDPYVVGNVGFVGKTNGLLYLYLPEKFARHATSHMLGMSEREVVSDGAAVVNDAIGELTNMTAGVFKNGLCDSGFSCRLTIPSILRGANFTIDPVTSSTRWIFYFDCSGHRLVVDVHMKPGE